MSSREFQVEREEHANTVFHESPCAMSQPQESPRSSRSNSLKPQSQIFLFPSRPKRRTLSLPSKPIIPPHIIIQGCHNNNDTQSEEEGKERSEVKKENMAWYTPLVGLSCSLAVYFLACALTYYSSRWPFFLYVPGHQTKRAADKKKHWVLQCNHWYLSTFVILNLFGDLFVSPPGLGPQKLLWCFCCQMISQSRCFHNQDVMDGRDKRD